MFFYNVFIGELKMQYKKIRGRSKLNRHNTLLIKFNVNSDKYISSWFKNFNLEHFKVSSLIQRWAVEVPFWKEEEYIDEFFNSYIVESIMQMPKPYAGVRQQEFVDE